MCSDPLHLELSLAGFDVHVTLPDPSEAEHIEARFGAYRAPARCSHPIELRIEYADGLPLPQPPEVPWPGARGRIEPGGTLVFERHGIVFRYDPQRRSGVATVTGPRVAGLMPLVAPTSIDTPLRLLLSYELPRAGGLLLHASGYGDERGAVVFPAASGGGKTTTANKLPPTHVLSDDQVALRLAEGRWLAYALPFVGMFAHATVPRIVPLRALTLLAKASAPSLERLRPAVALSRLMSCAPYFVVHDSAGLRALLSHAQRLASEVPVFTLQLALESPVMPYIEALLGS